MKIIQYIKGKRAKYWDIYMSDKLIKSLREYLKVRKIPFASTKTTNKELFLGERGPMTRQTAHHLMKKYADAAGIEQSKAHVHNLLHLFGLRLAAQGLPIQDMYLGHTSIEVTKIYLEKPQSHYVKSIDQL